jgi:ribosomal protein S18 acetylase RimI-like enzyme
MQSRIRKATKRDATFIARVEIETYRSTYGGILPESYLSTLSVEEQKKAWIRRLKERGTFILVSEDEETGKIFGFIYAGPARKHDPDHRGEVYAIYILPEHQRAGIGRTLIRSAAASLSRMGIHSLLIWVLSANPARKFYAALGGQYLRSTRHHVDGITQEGVAYGWKNIAVLQAYSDILPTKDQELLLRASLLKDQQALDEWTETINPRAVDPTTFILLPLLHPQINQYRIGGTLKLQVEEAYGQTLEKNRILFQALLRILESLEQARIQTLLLKEAALIVQYYVDSGLRPMVDLAILVPSEQAVRAIDILKTIGYDPLNRTHVNSSGNLVHSLHGQTFKMRSRATVHLYWLQEGSPDKNDTDLWTGSVLGHVEHTTTKILNPADQILQLCVLGARWSTPLSIGWIADVMTILQSGVTVDWSRLVGQCNQRRLMMPVCHALAYLRYGLRAPVPEVVFNELAAPTSKEIAEFEYLAKSPRNLAGFWYLYQRGSTSSVHRGVIEFARKLWNIQSRMPFPFYVLKKFLTPARRAKSWPSRIVGPR